MLLHYARAMRDTPIYKVGLVLVRAPGEVCLVQVKAKNPAEQGSVDFGLPKGTRRYLHDGQWLDARDAAAAAEHADALETLDATVRTEAAEEIGLAMEIFDRLPMEALGSRPFISRKGERYDIHWFVMEAPTDLVLGYAPDAHAVGWFTRDAARGLRMNDSYRAIIDEVLG